MSRTVPAGAILMTSATPTTTTTQADRHATVEGTIASGGCAAVANGARVSGIGQTDGSIQAAHVFVDKGAK